MAAEPLPIEELFWQALQYAEGQERQEFLRECCCGDDVLRRRLQQLLTAQPQADQILEPPTVTPECLDRPCLEDVGDQIDDYKLLEKIGDGGMGVVFMAEQIRPVRRKVAVKILKPGMGTDEVLGRFEQERQALAIMDHPHITRVFDAGTSASGRPYFVMELVRGVSITKFCSQQNFNSQQRLRLLVQVCRAVQHAHVKGIIHRDLKPSNVMVELHDVTPVPKVIDFGVAKAIHGRLIDRTVFTGYVQMIGTPLYMSPEQAELSGLDVDTRSDVYSLGVLLYELITGSTPFDRQRIRDAGYDELQRIIREEEPPRPSTRISTLNASGAATVNGTLDSRVPGFAKRLRHELDWVVMKALEKDRTRRYQSASELAADIERFLDDEPVLARPPTLTYRLTKLARRNKAALTLFVAVTAALLLGTAVSLWQAWRATDAQQLAEHRAIVAEQATANAQTQKTRADAARRQSDQRLYVADMKLASDAIRGGDIPRAAELLDRHGPAADDSTLPAFEWRYMNRLIDVRPTWQTSVGTWIRHVRLSPDGRLLAVAAGDGSVQVRDAKTGDLLQRFGSLSQTNSVAWSPDGRRIVSAADDGAVRLWNVETTAATESSLLSNLVSSLTDRPAQVIAAHETAVNDAIFTPDGRTLISAGDDATIRLWDAATGEALATLSGHSREVEQLAVSPDGTLIASASSDDTVAVWDFKSRKKRFSGAAQQDAGRMVCVSFSADGSLIAAGDINGSLLVGDVESETWTQTKLVDGIESVAFLENPLRVITGDRGGSVQLWELQHEPGTAPKIPPTPRARWIAHQGRVQGLAVNSRDEMILTGSRDSTVAAWPVGASTPGWQWAKGKDVCLVSNTEMLVCDRQLLRIDLRARKLIDAFLTSKSGWQLVVKSHDTPRIAVASDHTIVVYDLTTKREILREDFTLKVHRLAISPDGNQLAVAWWDQRTTIDVIDLRTTATLAVADTSPQKQIDAEQQNPTSPKRSLGGGRTSGASSGGGHWATGFQYTAISQDTLPLGVKPSPEHRSARPTPPTINCGRGLVNSFLVTGFVSAPPTARRSFPASQCDALEFSPDNRRLAVGHMDDVVVYDVSTNEPDRLSPMLHLAGHDSTLTDVAFSLDGTLLATVSSDRHLTLWNTQTGNRLAAVPAHHADVNSVTFSTDGATITTAGEDGAVRLWCTASLQPMLELSVPTNRYGVHAELTADGSRLLVHTIDDRILVYDAANQQRPEVPAVTAGDVELSDQTLHFQGLGDLPGGEFRSNALNLSSDGRFVVGDSHTAHGYDLFLWSESDGMQRIGPPRPQVGNTEAESVSDDGTVICGTGVVAGDTSHSAVLWPTADSVVRIAPGPSIAQDISADGTIVVGRQRIDKTWTAFRWTSDGLQPLPTAAGHRHAETSAVTRDGTLILGTMFDHPSVPSFAFADYRQWQNAQPVIWQGDKTRPLQSFAPDFNWHAADISDDGQVVTGVRWPHGEHRNGAGSRAFVWQAGEVKLLEPLPGCQTTAAAGISGDGRIIVGSSEFLRGTNWVPVPFVWDAEHGTRDLQQMLAEQGVALNWRLQHCRAISRDGRTIIGIGVNPQGQQESWRLQMPDGILGRSPTAFE